jgi:hypothetical protein
MATLFQPATRFPLTWLKLRTYTLGRKIHCRTDRTVVHLCAYPRDHIGESAPFPRKALSESRSSLVTVNVTVKPCGNALPNPMQIRKGGGK